MFPQRLDAPEAYAIAQALMHGYNQHYRMFSAEAARAKQRFETMDWPGQQQAQRERIEFYDRQVRACIQRLEEEFAASLQSMAVWQQVKLHYIGLLVKQLGIYPPGSVVQLSNGQVGLVMSVNPKRLLFPSVLIYDPAIPRQEAPIIDLEDVGLTIGKVISPTRLPAPVFEYLNPRTRISFYFDHSNVPTRA